jgi:lysophospholipase L1-like esterase
MKKLTISNRFRDSFPGRWVDLETHIPNGAKDSNGNSLWDDDLHFNPSGYLKMAELIYDVVKPKILEIEERSK